MKIVVTGGRDYSDYEKVKKVLSDLSPTEIFVGDAKGADSLAVKYAEENGIAKTVFFADWNKHGNSAGPIRNTKILLGAKSVGSDTIVVFPGGRGTQDCKRKAIDMGFKVIEVKHDTN